MRFRFIARCEDQSLTLEVTLDYKPGKQAQRGRRIAVGELLAKLEAQSAQVDASGLDKVIVVTEKGTWVIGESTAVGAGRGTL